LAAKGCFIIVIAPLALENIVCTFEGGFLSACGAQNAAPNCLQGGGGAMALSTPWIRHCVLVVVVKHIVVVTYFKSYFISP